MFLRYICENYRVHAFSSAHQYLLQFKQLYNRLNRRYIVSWDEMYVCAVGVHDRQDSRVGQRIAVGSGKLEAGGQQVGGQKH
jgi:hypothetical protein